MAQQEEVKTIKTQKKKRWVIILTVFLILIIAGAVFVLKRTPKQEMSYTYIRTTALTKGSLEDSISTTGTVESAETANVTTDLNYPVAVVNVAVGDNVKAGDVLCTLDTEDLESQIEREKKNLAKSQASAQSAYETAQENYNRAQESADDSKQALSDANTEKETAYRPYKTALAALQSYQTEYDSALTAYEKAGAKYVSAMKTYNNAVSKYKKESIKAGELVSAAETYMEAVQNYYGGLSIGSYDISDSGSDKTGEMGSSGSSDTISVTETANEICNQVVKQVAALSGKTITYGSGSNTLSKLCKKADSLRSAKLSCNYDSLESAYNTAENAYNLAEQSYDQCKDALEQAKTQLEQAKEQLSEAGSSDTLEELESQLEECEIKANQDGTITALNVTVGSSVNGMNAVATIASLDSLKVSVTISEADINTAKVGMSCKITSDASDEVLDGTLSQLDPIAGETGSFGAEVTVDSTTESLRIGMNASVEIIVSTTEDIYQVPIDAVGNDDDGQGDYIYRKTGGEGVDMTFEKVYVTTGEKNDYYIEIAADELQDGDVIRATADLTAGVETTESSQDTNLNFPFGGDMPSGNEGGKGGHGGGMPSGGGQSGRPSLGGQGGDAR